MRFATWNLQSGRDLATGSVDLPAVARAVAALEVDVLAVQEVDRGLVRSGGVDQVAELARLLGWHGVFAPALAGDPLSRWWPVPVPDDGGPAFGVGLLAREPLDGVATRALPGGGAGGRSSPASGPGWDREPRTVLRAVAAGGRAVTTTHLSYLPWRGLRQLRAALRFAGGGVLLGDLNLPVRVLDAALRGTGWTSHPAGPTFPAWKPGMQLDHVLSRGVAVSGAATGPASTSDHLPLVVTVT